MWASLYFADLLHNLIQSHWLYPPINYLTNYVSKNPLEYNLHESRIYVHTYHFFEFFPVSLTFITWCSWYSEHPWGYYHSTFPFQIGSHIFLFHVTLLCSPDHKNVVSSTSMRLVVNAQVLICSTLLLLIFVP